MTSFGFEVAHNYEVLRGCVKANTKQEAEKKILNKEWVDIIDTYDTDVFTEGYEVLDIWE